MLTKLLIENAKPGTKPRRLSDGRGMYLEIAPSGGKWWRFKYRMAGKERRVSLGVYPDVGLAEARERREQARKHAAAGLDRTHATSRDRVACSKTLRVCCAVTPGNHSRNSCTVAPPSIFSNNAATGTRVPRNTHAPLTRSASRSTAVQVVQSIILQSYALNRNGSMSAAKRLPNSRCRNQRCWSRWVVDRSIYFPPQLVNGLLPVY